MTTLRTTTWSCTRVGHAIHDYITNGNLSQNDGLSEGVGDYFASSYSRQFMKPDHPAYNWTFSWDGHNDWPGRVVNNGGHYPEALQGEVHSDGEIWASAMGDVYNAIGKDAADRDILQGLAMTNGSANQNDAANAVLKARREALPEGRCRWRWPRRRDQEDLQGAGLYAERLVCYGLRGSTSLKSGPFFLLRSGHAHHENDRVVGRWPA